MHCKERLEQTKFFYHMMEEEFKNPKIFDYYLNAFLTSGRSVTSLFKKEFSKNDKLMQFHKQKMETFGMEEEEDCDCNCDECDEEEE